MLAPPSTLAIPYPMKPSGAQSLLGLTLKTAVANQSHIGYAGDHPLRPPTSNSNNNVAKFASSLLHRSHFSHKSTFPARYLTVPIHYTRDHYFGAFIPGQKYQLIQLAASRLTRSYSIMHIWKNPDLESSKTIQLLMQNVFALKATVHSGISTARN